MRKYIILPLLAALLIAAGCNSTPSNNNEPVETISGKVSTEGWKEYRNNKYGYTITHPADLTINQYEGNGVAKDATSEGDLIRVIDNNSGFEQITVNGTLLNAFSEEKMKAYFTDTTPDKVTLQKVKIGDVAGYKAITDRSEHVFDTYFIERKDKKPLVVQVLKKGDIGLTILSTLKLQ